jgi:hypothetical protein
VNASGQITGYVECAPESGAVAAALAKIGATAATSEVNALITPSPSFVLRASADEAASIRTTKSLLARAETAAQAGTDGFKAVAFDVATGARVDTVGSSAWIIAGCASSQLDDVTARLDLLGVSTASRNLALPARIGAVALTLQDLPESNRVLIWQIAETDAQVACVSAAGCEAVASIPVGFSQLFDAVQAGLGLRFRAAATKLFFNASYDFSDAAGPIAERLAAVLRPSIAALGVVPTTLHVAGLPAGQAWLPKALASALELGLLAPDLSSFCAQRNVTGPAIDSGLPVSALGLLLHASQLTANEAPWTPGWLDEAAVVVTAPAPISAPAAASAPVKKASSAPAPAAIPPTSKPVTVNVAAGATTKPTASPKSAAVVKPAAALAPKAAAPAPVAKPSAPVRAPSAAPVAKSAKAAQPVPVDEVTEVSEEPEVTETVPPKKKPVALLAAVAAVVVLGGLGAVLFTRGGGAKTEVGPAVATISAEQLKIQEHKNALILAEEMASPRSFRNSKYSLEVSDRGYLRKLTDSSKRVLIDELGWIELQGTFSGTGKPFTAGTMADSDFTPSVTKAVREGKVVFEISGTHARFSLKTLVTCLPSSVKVETVFTPIQMTEYRGPLSLEYSVKMNRSSLALGQRGILSPGKASFATQAGAVELQYDSAVWGPVGEVNKQAVTLGGNRVLFNFAGASAEPRKNVLNVELVLP